MVLHQLDPQLGAGHGQVGQLVAHGIGQPRSGLEPRLTQADRDLHRFVEGRLVLLGQRHDVAGALVEGEQRLARLLGARDHLLGARPVTARQPGVDLQPLLHLGQAPRLGVEVLEVRPQPQPDLLERLLGRAELGVGRGQRGVDLDHRREGRRGRAQRRHDPSLSVARRQRLGGGRGGGGQPLGMAQALALGPQRGLLQGVDAGGVDLAHQLLQVVALALGRLAPGARGRQRAADARQAPPQRRQPLGGRADVRPGEGVEHGELAGGADQAPVLVLRREAHQRSRQRRDRLPGRRLPVDQGPGPPFGRHPAGDDHLALVVDELAQGQRRVVRLQGVPVAGGHLEGGLDQGVAGPRPHRRGVGRRPGEEPEGLRQHRLAGAGLPGDRRQAAGRRQLGPLDHNEVADLERADHGRPNFSR